MKRRFRPAMMLLSLAALVVCLLAYRSGISGRPPTPHVLPKYTLPFKARPLETDPVDIIVVKPTRRLESPSVQWRSRPDTLDISILIPVDNFDKKDYFEHARAVAQQLEVASSLRGEILLLYDERQPNASLPASWATEKWRPLVRLEGVSATLPWLRSPTGALLQHGLNASRGRRVLVMTPYVQPRQGFLNDLLASDADVVSCSVVTDTDVVINRGYTVSTLGAAEGRLELERHDFGMQRSAASQPPPRGGKVFPSIHCALFDSEKLRRAGGFATKAVAYFDALRQGLVRNTTDARQHWSREVNVQVSQFKLTASNVELSELNTLTRDSRTVFFQLDKYAVTAEKFSERVFGLRLPNTFAEFLTSGRIQRSIPLPLNDLIVEVAYRVNDVMDVVEGLLRPPSIPLDWIAWEAVVRMNDPKVEIRRDAIVEMRFGSTPASPAATARSRDDRDVDFWHDAHCQFLEQSSLVFDFPLPTHHHEAVLGAVVTWKPSTSPQQNGQDHNQDD